MKLILTILLSAFIISGCSTLLVPNSGKIKNSTEYLDLTNGYPEGGDEWIELNKMLKASNSNGAVLINWTIAFDEDLDGFYCANGSVTPNDVDLDTPDNINLNYATYHLPMNNYSTHFLVSVIIGSATQYPFNSVQCHYSGSITTITIQGYYSVISYEIPTAYELELRPLNLYGANINMTKPIRKNDMFENK